MRFQEALVLSAALAAFEDARTPQPVLDWLADARKHAPGASAVVAVEGGERGARIVVVGRAFPGTSELARFEGAIVSNAKSADVIALDVGWRAGEEIDRALRSRTGDIQERLEDAEAFAWTCSETLAWLAELSKREAQPKIVGLAAGDPKRACVEVLAYIGRVDPTALPRAEHALRALSLDGRDGAPRYMQLDDNERTVLRIGIEETRGLFRDAEETFTGKSSVHEYSRNARLLLELQQYEELMRFEREGGEHDPRGRIMAENALDALKSAPEGARLFALVGLRGLGRASEPDSFTAQLEKLGGARTFCIATACGSATFRAIDPNASGPPAPRELKTTLAQAGALERALAEAGGTESWILSLRAKPADPSVTAWLSAHRMLRSAKNVCGAALETPWDHAVLEDFDAIAWFPTVSASTLVR